MRRLVVASLVCVLLSACETRSSATPTVQFWRPVSEPNVLMMSDALQQKLDFDTSQCHCGIYPANAAHNDMIQFQKDKQRLAETGVTVMPDEDNQCMQKPSLSVTECMRQRGWEPTSCSGRVGLPQGGSLCASYAPAQ